MATLSAQHLSPELASFLAAEVEGDDPTSLDPLLADSGTSLDITTTHISLKGVDQELEHFRNHEVHSTTTTPRVTVAHRRSVSGAQGHLGSGL